MLPTPKGSAAPRDRVQEVDLLRFIAASSVVIYHLTYLPRLQGKVSTIAFGGLQDISRFGYLGVNLFFIISGFVILWSSHGRTPAEFVASRIARLYPSLWICVLLTSAVLAAAGRTAEVSPRIIALNLTMVPGILGAPYVDGVYWTLFVELKFYVLVFAVLLLRLMDRIEMVLAFWLACCAAGALGLTPHWVDSLAMAPFGPYFISGCIIYMIRSRGASVVRVAALALSCVLGTLVAIDQQEGFMKSTTPGSAAVVVCAIIAFHAIFLAVALRPRILPDSRVWYLLGTLTYPLYLLHNQIGKVVLGVALQFSTLWGALAIALIVIYALAWVVAAVSERRFSKQLHRTLLRFTSPTRASAP